VPGRQTASALAPLDSPRRSLADQAAAAIRRAVGDGDLRAGELYSAHDMADRLGVSRSPVREALMRLAEAGLVTFERNRGFRIVTPQARDIAEVFALRLLLEVPAARTAARAADESLGPDLRTELAAMARAAARRDTPRFMLHDRRLHARILGAAGNRRLAAVVESLRDATRVLGASTVERSRGLLDIWAEHEPIVAAVESHDASAAARAMREHVANTGRLLVSQASTDPAGAGAPLIPGRVPRLPSI
jgi:DNA-binding GntR family transcriptional regulator